MNFRLSAPHTFIILSLLTVCCVLGCEAENDRRKIVLEQVATDQDLQQVSASAETRPFYFGFDLRADPREDARQYIPFLKYLERKTGYRFELRLTPKNNSIVDDLGRGVIQFGAVGAGSYLFAHEKYDVISLARGLNIKGEAQYQACIVTSPQSGIRRIGDLRGKFMVFGGKTSTQGYLIPRIILAENNITLEDLAGYKFAGSHEDCAKEVIAKRGDACGMQDIMARSLVAKGLLRILFTSKYYPSSGIAANKDVAVEVLDKVKQALVDFQPTGRDAAGLYNWDRTEMPKGFVESGDADYEELRLWAETFDYLKEIDQ